MLDTSRKRVKPILTRLAHCRYCFTPSGAYSGKFTINYLAGKLRQEYFTPQPDGLRFR